MGKVKCVQVEVRATYRHEDGREVTLDDSVDADGFDMSPAGWEMHAIAQSQLDEEDAGNLAKDGR